jgi:hypothetical protein
MLSNFLRLWSAQKCAVEAAAFAERSAFGVFGQHELTLFTLAEQHNRSTTILFLITASGTLLL